MISPYYEREGVTLYHGDCLEVMREIEAGSVDFVFTDPPYGHNNNNNGDLIHRWEAALGHGEVFQEDARPIANDGPEANDLFRNTLAEATRLLSPGCCCCCCCCGGGGPDPQFARWSLWMDETPGMEFKQAVVWDKGPMGMGWHYRRSYEMVLVAQRKGAACRWFDESDRIENVLRHIRKIIPGRHQHPTEKPVKLPAWFIQLHTRVGDTVLDPFAGSGPTAIACIQLGRRFIGIEIEEKYCEIAAKRVERELAQGRLDLEVA